MKKWKTNIIYSVFIVAALGSLIWWQSYNPAGFVTLSIQGMDNRITGDSVVEVIKIGEMYTSYEAVTTSGNENWTRFRGEQLDNISKTKIPLIDAFKSEEPPIVWSVDLGEGHAGAVIYEGKAYVLDYDEARRADLLRCYELSSGKELWQRGYRISIRRNHGMSRTVPALNEKYILTVGPRGQVMCLDREDGNYRWGLDMIADYESELPYWYTGQCPLMDDDTAILVPGGKALMVAVDCETGEILWETPNPEGWKMSHASVMPWTFGGQKMYVYSGVNGVYGIAADGAEQGKVLWSTSEWNHSVVAPSAVCMPDGKVFLAAGYGVGSMMIEVKALNGKFEVSVLDEYKTIEGLASEQQTPLFYGGKLFGILPKDAGPMRNQFVCVNPDDPRKILWSSGKEARFGLGPYIIADNKLFILSDDGELTIARLSTTSWQQLDQMKILDGHDAWAPIAIADGYMIMRDSKTMVCLDMRKCGSNEE
ncbi:MAG: PQQ-binding-like beta-propeller repeat protein [Bacteroidetes bacterium]|jgi:outer membrane protein assembly factor BamB|nr:PQQ-binding-like beta-propeller repeat protein [Bacteroidota bacterium]MBT4398222.1 PQQ-binding-like beta-propeller repeat protein [Bacteroidota bacterium]MBT4411800.1 PQQ-binding-like beta-propeller repeat protein [Bacteroidota bacterium]MBT5426441.1 PQQ-binding-like beta-propeller repeat protein [Bacteroidota bacterium]MBT7465206.1 PQQ-binding-like beta-propeller repeat protein [Bacteroidota bacterium]